MTRSVPHHALERTRQQIAEYKRFRTLTAEFVEVSEQLCQARLTQAPAPPPIRLRKNAEPALRTRHPLRNRPLRGLRPLPALFRLRPPGTLGRSSSKTFVTVLGPLTLWRAYYHCPPCG